MKFIVITGGTGVGKSEVISRFRKLFSGIDSVSVHTTYTSRARRESEIDGVDYVFKDREFFTDESISWFELTERNGDYYGTPLNEFVNKELVITCLDSAGVTTLKTGGYDVFVLELVAEEIVRFSRILYSLGTFEEINARLKRLYTTESGLICKGADSYLNTTDLSEDDVFSEVLSITGVQTVDILERDFIEKFIEWGEGKL